MITLLKLGGSLITDKSQPHTPRETIIRQLGQEIFAARQDDSEIKLIIGHGSGSFGHVPAKKYQTRQGVKTEEEWYGFAEVHAEASALDQIVLQILREAGLPCISFTPVDQVKTQNGFIKSWDLSQMLTCLQHGLIPLIYGDTVFDLEQGGTILSTEDLFSYICSELNEPSRILLAGLEEGVWLDYPQNTHLVKEIDVSHEIENSFIKGSEFTDVTGGMSEKVRLMKELVLTGNADHAIIFSGLIPGHTINALKGDNSGTMIYQSSKPTQLP